MWALKETGLRQVVGEGNSGCTMAQRPMWQKLGEVAMCGQTQFLGRALALGQVCGGPGSGVALGRVV